MTASGHRLGAVVLAGGRSARFGRDKLAEPVDGTPMLDRAVDAVAAVDPDIEIVVVTAAGDARALPSRARRTTDPRPFEGPLAGLLTGLVALTEAVDAVVVVGGDMPSLEPAVLHLLVDAVDAKTPAAVLEGDDRARPLPMALHRSDAETAARRLLGDGERRLRALPTALGAAVVPAATWRVLDPDGGTLRDVDVPADLSS